MDQDGRTFVSFQRCIGGALLLFSLVSSPAWVQASSANPASTAHRDKAAQETHVVEMSVDLYEDHTTEILLEFESSLEPKFLAEPEVPSQPKVLLEERKAPERISPQISLGSRSWYSERIRVDARLPRFHGLGPFGHAVENDSAGLGRVNDPAADHGPHAAFFLHLFFPFSRRANFVASS